MTIAIDLSFSPLIQKAIKIISSKYHGIRMYTLEVIKKVFRGNLLLLRCLEQWHLAVHQVLDDIFADDDSADECDGDQYNTNNEIPDSDLEYEACNLQLDG